MTDETRDAGHGALMDSVYRYQRYIYDATRKYYLLGRDRLIDGLDVPDGGNVLEVACGTGRNLIRIGRAYPDARLYGFDISEEMLRTARTNLDRAGLDERASLARADATDFDPAALFGTPSFDRVVISYSLSMIPDWRGALREAARRTAPGGRVDIVDFGQQTGLPRWAAAAQLRWLSAFHVTPRAGLADAARQTAAAIGGSAEITELYRDYACLIRLSRPGN